MSVLKIDFKILYKYKYNTNFRELKKISLQKTSKFEEINPTKELLHNYDENIISAPKVRNNYKYYSIIQLTNIAIAILDFDLLHFWYFIFSFPFYTYTYSNTEKKQ